MLDAVRNFVVVFVIAAVVFGIAAVYIVGLISDNLTAISDVETEDVSSDTEGTDETDPTTDVAEDPVVYDDLDGESFNILLIGTDYRPDDFNDYTDNLSSLTISSSIGYLTKELRTKNADVMMLICVNEESRRVTFTCIPYNTRVSVNGTYYLLGTLYDKYGAETIVDYVSYLTSVEIDYYICANVTDAGALLDIIDGVEITIPRNILNPYYSSAAAEEAEDTDIEYDETAAERNLVTYIAISAGVQTINSSNIFALLHYDTESGSTIDREAVILSLGKAILEKAVTTSYITRASELFTSALSYVETNMTVGDVTSQLGLFLAFDEFTVITLSYPGTTSTLAGENCIIPDITAAYEMFRTYNNITTAD